MGLKIPPSPAKQMFADVVEEKEDRKTGLVRLSLLTSVRTGRKEDIKPLLS